MLFTRRGGIYAARCSRPDNATQRVNRGGRIYASPDCRKTFLDFMQHLQPIEWFVGNGLDRSVLPCQKHDTARKPRAIRRDFMRCARPDVRMGQDPSLQMSRKQTFSTSCGTHICVPYKPAGNAEPLRDCAATKMYHSVGTATFLPGSPRYKNVPARRAHQIYYLLSFIYYLLSIVYYFSLPQNIVSPAALLHNAQKTFTLWRKNSAKTLDKHPLYRV